MVVNAFKSEIFPLPPNKGTSFKILTPEKMLQRLSITLAQVKVSNTLDNLLNEIRQIACSLY